MMRFTEQGVSEFFITLANVDVELKSEFDDYLKDNYNEACDERLWFVDIAAISRFIVKKMKLGHTGTFPTFFNLIDDMLNHCDAYIENLIVVGLFEGIQNISNKDIDYHYAFDRWLPPLSKLKWDNLIDSWEGNGWRSGLPG